MNLNQITAASPEIAKEVMNRYPVTKAERRGCAREKACNAEKRWLYAKRLMVEKKEKQEYDQASTDKTI